MKFKYCCSLALVMLLFKFSNAQSAYWLKKVTVAGKECEFLFPPKTKIAQTGFIFHKKKPLTFTKDSRFRYQYVIIRDLKKEYKLSKEAVSKATYKKSKSKSLPNSIRDLVTHTSVSLGTYVEYFISPNKDNIVFQIDYDALLGNPANFKKYYLELFKGIAELDDKNGWGGQTGSVAHEIVKKIFELTPIPQDQSLGRYMALIDDNKSLVLLDPQIWLRVDNSERIRSKLPEYDGKGKLINSNSDFWNYNLYGQTLIKFYRNEKGAIMQYPLLKLSEKTKLPANTLNIDDGAANHPYEGTLQASTADIQLSDVIKKQKYIFLFQNDFKRNNSNATKVNANDDDNSFSEKNSQLLFNNNIDQKFIGFVDVVNPSPHSDDRVKYSTFGMRNEINAVIPVILNKVIIEMNFNSTIDINKNQGVIPPVKKMKIYRIYKNRYKKIRSYNDHILLLPNDKICY